jgi:hypothetical protein
MNDALLLTLLCAYRKILEKGQGRKELRGQSTFFELILLKIVLDPEPPQLKLVNTWVIFGPPFVGCRAYFRHTNVTGVQILFGHRLKDGEESKARPHQ